MEVKLQSSPFGSPTRTRVLLALRLLGQSYPRELARLLGVPLSVVQKAVRILELDGLVASRSVGRTRLVQLEPRHLARESLEQFLPRARAARRCTARPARQLRRRPRRAGNPL